MPTRYRRHSKLTGLLLPLIFAAVAGYFGWQSTRGTFNQEARAELRAERLTKADAFDALQAQREALEMRVTRLRTDALDADLLDERARRKLNLAGPKELIIFHYLDGATPGALAQVR